jgi:glycosyltransferase involved in cell wall biosynthesis
VLRSLAGQTDRGFEVVVADDGSGPRTAELVAHWKTRIGVPLSQVWQEKLGFRAGEIRNRALLASRGGYCVFLDGDCIARPDFVAAHRRLAEPGWFVCGNRVLLSRALTEAVLNSGHEAETWGYRKWLAQRFSGGINRMAPLLRLRLGPLRKLRARSWKAARSCNFAAWRADLDRVRGFDASFTGWGREDSDLALRMLRSGVARKDGEFATGVLHLWHPQASRAQLADNDRRLDETALDGRVRAQASAMLSSEADVAAKLATRT